MEHVLLCSSQKASCPSCRASRQAIHHRGSMRKPSLPGATLDIPMQQCTQSRLTKIALMNLDPEISPTSYVPLYLYNYDNYEI